MRYKVVGRYILVISFKPFECNASNFVRAGENNEVVMTYQNNKDCVPEIVDLKISPELIAKNDTQLVESLIGAALTDIFQKELPKMNKIFE